MVKLFEGFLEERWHLVEFHELWLKTEHRGKESFTFFGKFIQGKGYNGIICYSDNLAAIAICLKRGYREATPKRHGWHTFTLLL